MSNGNVFTDDFRSDLPKEVKEFLEKHAIELVFKHEVDAFSDRSKGSSLSSNGSSSSSNYKELTTTLSSLCNPIVDEEFVKKEDANDVCYKHFFKRSNRFEKGYRRKWSKRGNILKISNGKLKSNNIGTDYIRLGINALLNPKSGDKERDIIMLVDSGVAFKQNQNSDRVVGFLMTELGECNNDQNDYGHVPALNLICAPRKHVHSNTEKECIDGRCSVIGRILLFMYLYALKRKNIQYALLELAGLYCNIKGLCLYNKFGFREDVSLVEKTCFSSGDNLAMICNLNSIKPEQLIDALINNKAIDVPHKEPLCTKMLLNDQRIAVDTRMENYLSMLELQRGVVTVDDVKKYINNLPNDKKKAVKLLGLQSKDGVNFNELKQAEEKKKKSNSYQIRQVRQKTGPNNIVKKKTKKITGRVTRSMARPNKPANWSFKNTSNRPGLSKGLNSGERVILHKRRRSTRKKYGW